ncbi:MAG: hypothetical protein IJW99_07605 [Clostridia bacterium]|nr:hypothetical protein [Clostridia bacterium]
MNGIYKIAACPIEVRSLHREVHRLCRDYLCEETPEIMVETAQADIEYERERSLAEDRAEGRAPIPYTDGYLETLAVYRRIADRMLSRDTLLFHGSCIAVDGVGYLFTAKSGTGKSTHTRLWRELFGARAVMVNDDKPLIRITDGGATVYGTPWRGKHQLGENIAVPLRAICVLERAVTNTIRRVDKMSIYPLLLQQTHRPKSGADMTKTLTLVDRLTASVGLYRLGCNMDIEAARVAFEGMEKNE